MVSTRFKLFLFFYFIVFPIDHFSFWCYEESSCTLLIERWGYVFWCWDPRFALSKILYDHPCFWFLFCTPPSQSDILRWFFATSPFGLRFLLIFFQTVREFLDVLAFTPAFMDRLLYLRSTWVKLMGLSSKGLGVWEPKFQGPSWRRMEIICLWRAIWSYLN